MLLTRANAPLAVLRPPVVLLESAPVPVAVFSSRGVLKKCPGAYAGVEAAGHVSEQRIPTNCCVPRAGRKILKGVLPFRRHKAGIAPIGCGDDRFPCGRKCKAGKHDGNEKEGKPRRRPAD